MLLLWDSETTLRNTGVYKRKNTNSIMLTYQQFDIFNVLIIKDQSMILFLELPIQFQANNFIFKANNYS